MVMLLRCLYGMGRRTLELPLHESLNRGFQNEFLLLLVATYIWLL
jgi:hypothetical protein